MNIRRKHHRKHHRKQRRGVVLLIVLSLLVLFVFIGVTFVVLAGVQQEMARAHAKIEEREDLPTLLLDEALVHVLRGTNNQGSAVWRHDLLGDLYGTDDYASPNSPIGVRGKVATPNGAVLDANGQLVRLTVTMNAISVGNARLPGYYNGCVFTMLSGPAQGMSTRVTQFYPAANGIDTLIIEMPPEMSMSSLPSPATAFSGGTFLINGRPFNGTGAGYNSTTDQLDLTVTGLGPVAMLPNYGRYASAANVAVAIGGADESYDAPDFQNMFLAYMPVNPTSAADIIPSFHRPELAAFWQANGGAANSQYYVLRPHTWSPFFNGSNPAYADVPIAGANRWDVDNDSDGITDSIWIDAGFPIKTDASGRQYKPLFAYLILDLDGRINVNTAGNFGHLNTNVFITNSSDAASFDAGGDAAGVASGTPITVPRGQGVGPADINLAGVLGVDATPLMIQRYGPDFAPGASGQDPLSYYRDFGVPTAYSIGTSGLYGSPPDLSGRSAVFIGPNGQPQYRLAGNANEPIDDPYEINLVQPNAHDRAFTVAEFERLARWYDPDATSLPTRLLAAAPNVLPASMSARRMITTASFHIPAPNTQMRPGLRSESLSPAPLEYFSNRLRTHTVAFPEANIPPELARMLPWELLQNRPMDLNRPFGDGRDDPNNSNGVVDEFFETGEAFIDYFGNSHAPDYVNDTSSLNPAIGGLYARQIYARHLYCMMMFFIDKDYLHPTRVEALDAASQQELTARLVAQWAVNCVDFRDSDAIMTPFEFDINPFDGWTVDDDISTNDGAFRGLVWGCEYPDLVLTETLAFHDVRLADTDVGEKRKKDDDTEGDDDLDSVRIPQGSLFVEMRCMRNRGSANPSMPLELYDVNGNLDLGRLAPGNFPVWRIVISGPPTNSSAMARAVAQPDTTAFDPVDMDRRSQVSTTLSATPIERVIWFAPLDPTGNPVGYDTVTYYNRTGNTLLAPGNYAVIGPRPVTYIGRQRAATAPPAYSISLTPGGNPQVASVDSTGTTTNRGHAVGGDIQPPLALICAATPPATWTDVTNTAPNGIGINVSEPNPQSTAYYPEPTFQLPGFPTVDSYRQEPASTGSLDEPLDKDTGTPLEEQVPTNLQTGTTLDFKSCFLQRLANPLAAYNAITNPYITVDWATIDLTVFNGEDEEPGDWAVAFEWNPDDPDPFGSAPEEKFGARQRGSGGLPASFWSPLTNAPSDSNASAADLYFDHEMIHTLGYLNETLGAPISGGNYRGEPVAGPIPWVAVLNRPYVSPYELLLVPCSEPDRLTLEITPRDPSTAYAVNHSTGEFNHLLNFFQASTTAGAAANFYRIFEFVDVPSRFVGTRREYNPAHFVDTIAGPAYPGYRVPFNYTLSFRDPGRVNINTIPYDGHMIWRSVSGLPAAESDAQWNLIRSSRAGPASTGTGTNYGGVFRSMSSGDLGPLPALQQSPIQAGLLREGPTAGTPLLASTSTDAYRDSSQHAFFRYQEINRLSQRITTHSNVYAVWITVGYFAVDPMTGQIRQEIGVDTGDVERHRAFYIIDRSIPVAYEPGQNHNVRKCVVLERFIE